jgi:YD repeat-containing protein
MRTSGNILANALTELGYTYNAVNNRTSATREDGRVENYGYDAAQQVTGANYGDGTSEAFNYDLMGNLTTRTNLAGGVDNFATNNLNQYVTVNGNVLSYDGKGNLLSWTGGTVPTFDHTQLWLEFTNVNMPAGWTGVNLHHATNLVYAIKSTTNVATSCAGWQVETEVWPTDTNCMAFSLATLNRQNLYLRAMDWTGVDSDGDGIPDWWIWKYFGNLSENSTNLDSQGNTLLSDFTNGLDPNIISFTVRLGSQHFNSTPTTGQFVVSAGTPSFEAVLVNDTNLDDAIWNNYDGNITLNLGSTDGVYQVLIGLKGRAPDSLPTWLGTTVYLDQTAPVLTITNPVSGTVALPYIQLQGLANERIASVTYDVSNAVGVATGQPGYVTGEFLDTNRLTFTTNYFQCFDIPLAAGANVITVHATDLAGNIGSLMTSYTLDYSGKTNPPVITLDWPQAGMQIGQSNITVSGFISDPTAGISLQVTDGSGNTNTLAGTVERDGHFWIQNVPLNGTNVLTLMAQDVVSNNATMNLTAIQNNNAGLSIDPVSGDLWESTVTVSGTIGDDSFSVMVNGVQATNDGYGGWTAFNVPIGDGNMAMFNAKVTTEDGTNEVQTAIIKPAALKLAAATWRDEQITYAEISLDYGTYDMTTTWNWTAGKGGSYARMTHIEGKSGISESSTIWDNAPVLADRSVPFVHTTSVWDGGSSDSYGDFYGEGGWQHDFPQEQGSLSAGTYQPTFWWEQKSGEASWVLHAGGLSVANNSESLFALTGTAMEESKDGAISLGGFIGGGTNVLGPEITNIGKQEDTNYLAYQVLPTGATVQAPVQADRPLTKDDNGQTKYYPVISWVGGQAITNTQDVIVGQAINLACRLQDANGNPPPPGYIITNYQWTVPGYALTNFYTSPDVRNTNGYPIPLTVTKNQLIYFFWADGQTNRVVQCLIMFNGNTITAQTIFNVLRPTARVFAQTSSVELGYNIRGEYWGICFGTNGGNPGILFSNTIKLPAGTNYNFGNRRFSRAWLQTIIPPYKASQLLSYGTNTAPISIEVTNAVMLDTSLQYPFGRPWPTANDSPCINADIPGQLNASIAQKSVMWLMFKPDGGQWVPLRTLNWNCSGSATNIGTGWILTDRHWSTNPPDADSGTTYPVWTNNIWYPQHFY